MDDLVPYLYSEYGKYVNGFRAFPYISDGLKLVERRLLYSLYEVAKTSFVKSAKVIGHCMGNYHPHGDTSLYQTLVNMVTNDKAVGQGNWGSTSGIEVDPAAAMRYTEVKTSKIILEDCLEFIKYIDMIRLELEEEPIMLPCKLPMCLLGNTYTQGIGFGFKTLIPVYKKDDLVKRLKWLLTKNGTEPIIKPISSCKILNDKKDLKKLLTSGYAQLSFRGTYKVIDNKTLSITSLPPQKSFQVVINKFKKEISVDKSLAWRDESSKTKDIRLVIVKPRMLKMLHLKKKLESAITGSLTFNCHMVNNDGEVMLKSVDDMLLKVYKNYINIVKKHLTDIINKNQETIKELLLIERIKPILSIQLKKNPNEVGIVIDTIATLLNVSKKQINMIFNKYTITRLFKIKIDVKSHQDVVVEYKKNLKNINEYTWNKYE